jgi:hypothetical protein
MSPINSEVLLIYRIAGGLSFTLTMRGHRSNLGQSVKVYFIGCNVWLFVALAAYVGKAFECAEPAMYSFFGVSQWFTRELTATSSVRRCHGNRLLGDVHRKLLLAPIGRDGRRSPAKAE